MKLREGFPLSQYFTKVKCSSFYKTQQGLFRTYHSQAAAWPQMVLTVAVLLYCDSL